VPASLRFDQIWSNPPIRIGKQALHGLLVDWFGRLQDDGEGWLTVQQHLGADSLQRWLTDHGFTTVRAASAAGFRILRSQASAAQRVDGDPKT
jgi:16S rRNA G1207 methylase RsmC